MTTQLMVHRLEDDSARSWTAVASWTGPCTEADCTNKSVTYGDVDDWLHTSAAAEVSANNKTFDGTASVDILADPEDCSWDLMPTTLEDEDDISPAEVINLLDYLQPLFQYQAAVLAQLQSVAPTRPKKRSKCS